MRKFMPFLVLVVLILGALACGSDADTDTPADTEEPAEAAEAVEEGVAEPAEESEPTEEPEPTEVPTEAPTATPTEAPIGTSRDNPAPLNTPVEVPNYTMTLTSVTRPANDIVAAGNMFNSPPDEGYEYVMVEVTVTCKQDECAFSSYNLGVVGSESVVYDPEFVSGVDGMLESGEMLEGGTLTGKLFFIVKQGETDLVLRWEPLIGDEAFMEIPEASD